ncbi:SDR family NAD(P)-dependent oxidoreductase [Dactylosporangium sp. CA-092794]|uniref:SDR family NAD(P)-dependent oxidoreductase n=1 Tax=Dactylosporangium sp. CA-092794 TaxID=3239929 RepID=UPI003D935D96
METEKHAVVTAGTAGLGFETARGLIRAGYDVTVIGRDPQRGREAVERLHAERAGSTATFLVADLSTIGTVRALGARLAQHGPLGLLVNNVGGMWPDRWETADGIEGAFALNHLAPYLLTEALMPALVAAAPSRIVHVTSGAIQAGTPDYSEVDLPGEYYGLPVTGRAKLANLAWALDEADRLARQGVTTVVADPGAAATPNAAGMRQRMLPPAYRSMWEQIVAGTRTPASDAAKAIITACLAPGLEQRPGTIIGTSGEPDDTLRGFLTPEVTTESRALTRRVLTEHGV